MAYDPVSNEVKRLFQVVSHTFVREMYCSDYTFSELRHCVYVLWNAYEV